MPISGLLLTCEPERVAEVSESVNGRARSEVREVRDSTLVVVTDTETMRDDRREVESLEAIDGVIAAHVVFSNVEDLAEHSRNEMRTS
jgi:nitrate reductase NapAB chaperone NapD